MCPALTIALFLAAFALVFVLFFSSARPEDTAVLRHTVHVNLRILHAELRALNAIVQEIKEPSADEQQAYALLHEAQVTADDAAARLHLADAVELQTLLGSVFKAMDQSNQAGHLLNAFPLK